MIFVTGGTGFLGSHLLNKLAKEGKSVIALKRKASNFDLFERVSKYYGNDNLSDNKNIIWRNGDLLHLDHIFNEFPDIREIYHAAALVSFAKKDRKQLYETNVLGTQNLVDTALRSGKIQRFCFVSSIAATGREIDGEIISEETQWADSSHNTFYGISKHLAELEVFRGMAEGLNACIINPGIILGPGEIKSGSLKMIKTVEDGLKFYPPGSNGFVDVRDVANIMISLMKENTSGERYILVSENLDYKTLFTIIAKELKKKPPHIPVTPLMGNIYYWKKQFSTFIYKKKPLITRETLRTSMNNYQYSNKKILQKSGISFISVEQSIRDTISFNLSLVKKNKF